VITLFYSYLDSANHYRLMEKYAPILSLSEQSRISKFHDWKDAQATLIGKILINKVIEDLGINKEDSKILYNDYGKPFFQKSQFHFNISHSGNVVVCAFGDEEIGVDIEEIREVDFDLFKSCFTLQEWCEIQSSRDKCLKFYDLWTKKEAAIKLVGKGFALSPDSFDVSKNRTIIEDKIAHFIKIDLNSNYLCHLASHAISTNTTNIKTIFVNDFL